MRVLAINGSPNREGTTARLIDAFLDECKHLGATCERINIEDYSLYSCQECGKCLENIECELDDDYTQLKAKMLEADAIVIGSPYYDGEVVLSIKTLMQRLVYSAFYKKDFTGKYTVGVSTSAVDDSSKVALYCANLGLKSCMGGFIISSILSENTVFDEGIKDLVEDNQVKAVVKDKVRKLIEDVESNFIPENFEDNKQVFNKGFSLEIIKRVKENVKTIDEIFEDLIQKGVIKKSKNMIE